MAELRRSQAPPWDNKSEAELEDHYRANLSIRAIAAAMGRSRGSISGKLSRLGLADNRDMVAARKRAFGRQLQANRETARLAHAQRTAAESPPAPTRPPAVRTLPVQPPRAPASVPEHAVGLLEIRDGRCRYPLWGHGYVRLNDKFFCGADSGAFTYCDKHSELCGKPNSLVFTKTKRAFG